MIYINNCKLLIINRCKDIKKYQLLNYSSLLIPPTSPSPSHTSHNSHRSHPSHCPCGSHPTPPIPARTARTPPSFSESLRVFFKKYFPHFQLTTKNFQKKLRKNLQDKKNAVPLHPQMRRTAALRKRKTTRTLT